MIKPSHFEVYKFANFQCAHTVWTATDRPQPTVYARSSSLYQASALILHALYQCNRFIISDYVRGHFPARSLSLKVFQAQGLTALTSEKEI